MTKKIISILLILVLFSLFIVGCTQKSSIEQSIDKTTETEGVQDIPTTGEPIVDDVSIQISDIDSIDEELDDSDLDSLEEDIANIDW